MTSCSFIRRPFLTVSILLSLIYLIVPVVTIQIIPTDNPQPYIYEVEILEKLDEPLDGKLEYYRVTTVQGTSPDQVFVSVIDKAYTKGSGAVMLKVDQRVWMQGDLMTPEVYYGEQYLFFGLPQIYVSQLKPGLLWPDQVSELTLLYGSPATSLLAPFSTVLILFRGLNAITLTVFMFKSLLLAASGYLTLRYRGNEEQVIMILCLYCVLAMFSTIPIMGELY
jgi:hypothetical protein